MNKKQILNTIQTDFKAAQSSRHLVETAISRWKRTYDGKPYGNEQKHRSSIVMKDVQKHIQTMRPSLTEPFLSSDTLIKVKATNSSSQSSASFNQHILNYQWNRQFDKLTFIDTISSVLPKEGTVYVRTGWDFEEEVKVKNLKSMSAEEVMAASQVGEISEVVNNEDGTVDAKLVMKKTIKNQPTAQVCKNENIYTDPTAENFEDSKFVIHEFEMSLSDIKKNSHIYTMNGESTPDVAENDRWFETYLGSERYADTYERGQDFSFNFSGKASRKIKLLEYWGEADIHNNGVNQQIVCVWIRGTDKIIRLEENPYPNKKIPFVSTPYDREAFSMWGNAVAHPMEDNQKIHTAIMRGFIDNMALSNNGQKFFQKGAIDYPNMKKLTSGYRFIELNDINGMVDGKYNEMPQSSFNIYNMIEDENESLSGVTKNMNGLDSATVGRTASGVNAVMGAAQRRALMTVRNISNMFRKMFENWASYNSEFLDDDTIFDINGEFLQVNREQLEGQHDFEVRIGMDSQNQAKIQQINMMMQQLDNSGGADASIRKELVSEFFDAMGKNEMAEKIRNTPDPQPSPQEVQMMELDIAMKAAEVEKVKADAQLKAAQAQQIALNLDGQGDMQKAQMDMQIDMMKAESDIQLATTKLQAAMLNEKDKVEQELALKEQKAAIDRKVAIEKAQLDMSLKRASQSEESSG